MPKLKYFIFLCRICEIDNKNYEKIIGQLLSFNIKSIELSVDSCNEEYSDNELKKICKDIKIQNFEKIKIKKLSL